MNQAHPSTSKPKHRYSTPAELERHQFVVEHYPELYHRPWVPPNDELTWLNFGNQLSEFSGIRAEQSTSFEHRGKVEDHLDQWNPNFEDMIKLADTACNAAFKTKVKERIIKDYRARRKAFAGLVIFFQEVFRKAGRPRNYQPRIWVNGPKYVQMCETLDDTLDWCFSNRLGILNSIQVEQAGANK